MRPRKPALPPALDSYRREISHCVRCGVCRAVCPSFQLEREESHSPRGRIALIHAMLDKQLPLSSIFKDRLATCTSCLACETACPSNVPVTAIIQAAKEDAVRASGRSLISSFVGAALTHDRAMRSLAWLAPVVLRYAGMEGKSAPGRGRRFGITMNENPSPYHLPSGERIKAGGDFQVKGPGPKGRIAFYPGCAIKHFQPDIGAAAVAVLERAGYDVVVLDDAACCGRPLLSLGDREAAQAVAEQNQQLFSSLRVEAVVTACASCGLTFKSEYPKLLALSGTLPMPVLDIHELLAGAMDALQPGTLPQRITWHDPCHLGRGQGLAKTARAVLQSLPGIELVETAHPGQCCGFGGIMRIGHHRLSNAIGDARAKELIGTAAPVVVTGCPGCRMQLAESLKRAGSDAVVLHTVQMIEMRISECGMRNEEKKGPGAGKKQTGAGKERV
jgi:glycolate oxidase iron-sulfur subunit